MAEAIVRAFQTPVGTPHKVESIKLVPSGGGAFEVTVDGHLVFSKKAVRRHAVVAEVIAAIKSL